MQSVEPFVLPQSDYYIYQPSVIASKLYLYPLQVGYFYYEPGYYLRRNYYENYLLMTIIKGECRLSYNGTDYVIQEGQAVLIDCRIPHEYGNLSDRILEISWMHFDGALAGDFYSVITNAHHSNVISVAYSYEITHNLEKLLRLFRNNAPIREAAVSGYITRMLSELLSVHADAGGKDSRADVIEASLAYIREHFSEPLTLEQIAGFVNLSPYYFTRLFSKETGLTPHQYVIATRINYAKYLLQSKELPVKEIAFTSGFMSESSFCSTFRKREGVTPGEYRARTQSAMNNGFSYSAAAPMTSL